MMNRLEHARAAYQADPWHYRLVAGVLWLGVVLRLVYITRGMRSDEADTFIQFASLPLPEGLTTYTIPNNHLLNTFLIHLSHQLLGNAPWTLRLPALLAGLAVLPVVYVVARRMYNKHVALMTLGLTSVSAAMIEYSVNARGYSILALVTLILLGLAHHLHRQHSPRLWVAFGVLAALGFYAVPTMLYPMGMISLYLLLGIGIHKAGAARWRMWGYAVASLAGGALLTGVLYAPVIAVSGWDSLSDNQFVQPHDWSGFLWRFEDVPYYFQEFAMWQYPLPLMWVGWALFFVGIAAHRPLGGDWVAWPALGLAWVMVVMIAQRLIPPQRTWTAFVPLFYMTIALGTVYLLRSWPMHPAQRRRVLTGISLGATVVVALLILSANSVYHSHQTGKAALAEDAALVLRDEYLQPGDRIISPLRAGAPLQYYLDYHNTPRVYELRTHYDQEADFIADIHRSPGDVYVFAEPYESVDDLFEIFINLERPDVPLELELLGVFDSNRLYRLRVAETVYR